MAYVRKKRVYDDVYYQLVEGYRENGKVKQRVLVHLGPYYSTVDMALEKLPEQIEVERKIMRYYPLRAWDGKLQRITSLEKRLEKIRDLRERGIA
jgi:hypothetical protein